MIKEFCDICKVEIDNQNVLAIVSTPVKNYKVCNFKLENKRYERDYRNKWEEIY